MKRKNMSPLTRLLHMILDVVEWFIDTWGWLIGFFVVIAFISWISSK